MESYHESQNISLLPPNIPNIKGEKRDEEANNGPLDFSLHRTTDCDLSQITLDDINSITLDGVSGQLKNFTDSKPRIKLTMRETPDQREKRLFEGRVRMKRLRSTESQERRAVRLQKARYWQCQRRQRERDLESNDQKEFRLTLARERIKLRRAQENPDERERRLKRSRERSRFKRSQESEDERINRLNKQRTNKRDRYHLMTKEEKTQLRQRERLCRGKSTRSGTNVKYTNDEEEELESYFQIRDNSVEENTSESLWVPEPEVCLSVETSEKPTPHLNPREEQSADTYLTNESSLNLQEQISQHVSNLVSLKNEDSFSDPSISRQYDERVTADMQPLEGFYVGSTSVPSMPTVNSMDSHKDGMLKRQGFEYMRMNPTIESEGFHSIKRSESDNVETMNSGGFQSTKSMTAESISLDQGQYMSQYKSNNGFTTNQSQSFTPNQICDPNHHSGLNGMHQIPQERYEMGN